MRIRFVCGVLLVALLACAFAAPAQARYSPRKAIWGPTTLDGASAFPLYQQLGVGIYQAFLPWNEVAPTRPVKAKDPADPAYRWPAELTSAIEQARRSRMRVMLQIIMAPPWANGGRARNWAPTRAQDLADFARAAARRYPTVRLWMIWGEPSRAPNFQPMVRGLPGRALTPAQAAAPRRYARMLDAAYGALKAVSRRNLVIGGNTFTAGDILPRQWVQNLRLPDGRPPRMDMYGHNPFTLRRPNLANPPLANGYVDFSDLARFEREVSRRLARPRGRRSLKLFLSEWTIPTAPDQEFNFHVDPPVQAQWIDAAFRIVNRLPYIYALGWIHVRDDPPASFGGLLDANGRPKPGFYAFQRG